MKKADDDFRTAIKFMAATAYAVFGVWVFVRLDLINLNAPGSLEDKTGVLRNLVLTAIAYLGLPLAIWRSWIAKGQLDRSNDQVRIANDNARFAETGRDLDRFQKGMQMLGGDTDSERIGGIITLDHLARDNPDGYGRIVIDALNGVIERESLKRPTAEEFDLHRAFKDGEIVQQPIMNEIANVAARHSELCKTEEQYQWKFGAAAFCSLSLDGGNLTNTLLFEAAFYDCRFHKVLFPEDIDPGISVPGTLFTECHFLGMNLAKRMETSTLASMCRFFNCSFFGEKGAVDTPFSPAFLHSNTFWGCEFSDVSFKHCDDPTFFDRLSRGNNWAWDDRAPILPEQPRFKLRDGFLVDHKKRPDYEATGRIGHPHMNFY